ncbi:hypothetical protein QWY85_00240 [Neolewinella lacunae]|uniref:Lipoprotein n=1 Tax=Neolewinella lacunae TaxID=1517758 RepID=A0A923T9R8_9BACT|nr:hypothetical protein [Neolewinella lacunae]MBC6995353.1 hypothetical protein [Neolewinella lacunae]MDN3633065.1 hypothetical protein [Neolewinella lacunae]
MRLLCSLLLSALLLSCAGDGFDSTAFPADQIDVELAHKRLKDHGDLEPVLLEEQPVEGWQFYVEGYEKVAGLGGDPVERYRLKDRSGVRYEVNSATSPEVIAVLQTGQYGFARGRVGAVKRDLLAGDIEAELLLTAWQVREE